MCTLLVALEAHPGYPLVIAANRDERHARSSAPAMPWPDAPHVLGGRDLVAGGTWLGIAEDGRWAAVTNVRDATARQDYPRSRGWLTRDYLLGDERAASYLAAVQRDRMRYGGFNLLVGERDQAWFLSNRSERDGEIVPIAPGVHGVSNASLDTPWPKVQHGRAVLARALAGIEPGGTLDVPALLDALADRRRYPDEALPHTGVGIELERALSPLCIAMPGYGTRSSTVIMLRATGEVDLVERTIDPGDAAEAVARTAEVHHRRVLAQR